MTSPCVRAYYNEHDPNAATWLRELIARDLIAPGDVDERSIADVTPADLAGYVQCHFFAGIGVWSHALRLAGWPDDRPVWTGSCPCPSFSAAGKGLGFSDPRHLWPQWQRLIAECRPPVLFGEQVAAAIGHGWLDLVQSELEAEGYAVGKAVLGACSVGAPHRRQRLYFVGAQPDGLGHGRAAAHASEPSGDRENDRLLVGDGDSGRSADPAKQRYDGRRTGEAGNAVEAAERGGAECEPERLRDVGLCSDPADPRRNDTREHGSGRALLPARSEQCGANGGSESLHSERRSLDVNGQDGRDRQDAGRTQTYSEPRTCGEVLVSGNSERTRLQGHGQHERDGNQPGWLDQESARLVGAAGATRGFWADCDWWYGRDGKYRPIEPGLFPLAHGAPCRVGRLRGYGNAVVPQVAAAFIEAFGESCEGLTTKATLSSGANC